MATTPSGRQHKTVVKIDQTNKLSGFCVVGVTGVGGVGGVAGVGGTTGGIGGTGGVDGSLDSTKRAASSGTAAAACQLFIPFLHTSVCFVTPYFNKSEEAIGPFC